LSDLILQRDFDSGITTMGELSYEDRHLAWTLEPPHNNPKEPKCIPPCRAQVIMQWSTRFQMDTPHLLGVPGRTLIEIHPLNDEHLVTLPDGSQHWTTEGCIGVGETKDVNWVGTSVKCLKEIIIPLVEDALKKGDLYIQIKEAQMTPDNGPEEPTPATPPETPVPETPVTPSVPETPPTPA